MGIKFSLVPTTVYSNVEWDQEQNGLDLDAVWGNSLTLEHSGFFRKCLGDLAVLYVVVLGTALKLGREMGLPLIIYNNFPWGSEFVLRERILKPQPFCIFTQGRLGSDRLPRGSRGTLKTRHLHRR